MTTLTIAHTWALDTFWVKTTNFCLSYIRNLEASWVCYKFVRNLLFHGFVLFTHEYHALFKHGIHVHDFHV